MPDILIRGIKIPDLELEYMKLWVYGDGRVYWEPGRSEGFSQRLPESALQLQEGHGRLKDVDALEDMDFESCDTNDCYEIIWRVNGMNHIRRIIKDAPTIVPADVTDNYVGSKSEEGETDDSKL